MQNRGPQFDAIKAPQKRQHKSSQLCRDEVDHEELWRGPRSIPRLWGHAASNVSCKQTGAWVGGGSWDEDYFQRDAVSRAWAARGDVVRSEIAQRDVSRAWLAKETRSHTSPS